MIVFSVASAQEPAEAGFTPKAELRVLETLPSAFPVDAEGHRVGWGPAADGRLRLGLHYRTADDGFRGEAELDVASGQWFGETWNLPAVDERGRHTNDAFTTAGLAPRKLSLGGRLPWFDLEAGLTAASWGLGMVANDGGTDPLFGRTDFGDRSLRVRLATAPFPAADGPGGRLPLYVLLVGDRVVADDLARWGEGDRAYQGILALLYVADTPAHGTRPGTRRAGAYGVVRDQTSSGGERLEARVLDGFVDWTWHRRVSVRVAAEGAFTFGRTDAARAYLSPEGVRIGQGGLAVRTELGIDPLTVHLRGAWASGDTTTDDDRVNDFRFDRDYDVGLVLFDEYLSALNLGAWRLATDPSLAAEPPDGVDLLVDEGAFHAATALQPAVEWTVMPWLGLKVGTVLAWSTGPIANPWTTFVAGGVPSNQLGQPTTGRWLGAELDWGVTTRDVVLEDWVVRPSFELQVGHAWPGAAFGGGAGRIDHALLAGRVRF